MADADGTVAAATETTKDALQERFRQAAQTRLNMTLGLQKELQKQALEMEELRNGNSQLQTRLMIQRTSPAHFSGSSASGTAFGVQGPSKKIAMQKAKELEKQVEEAQSLDSKIKELVDEIQQQDSQLGELRKQVSNARASMGGVFVTRMQQEEVERKLKVLESRLDKALLRFNRALDENTSLRREIEDLTRERLAFDSIYKELERELQMKKKKMACVIELSNIAYEERDAAANELAQLKVYAKEEMKTFEESFKELDLILADDRQTRDAIRRRLAEAAHIKQDGAGAAAAGATAADRGALTTTTGDEERRTVAKGRTAGRDDRALTLQQYEERFQKLRLKTGVTEIHELVAKYLHEEDDNFSLFNYVNELNTEGEKLEEQRTAAKEALEAARAHEGADFADAAARRRQLKQLEQRLIAEEEAGQRYRQKTDEIARVLEDLMVSIQTIFTSIGCDEDTIVEQHGTAGVSETSVLLYLSAIEQQADRLIFLWRTVRAPDGIVVPAGPLRGPALPPGSVSATLHIEAPSTGEDLHEVQSDDDDAKVLTRAELVARTQQKLAKSAAGAAKPRRGRARGR